jgi:hypothetical protein
MRQGPGRAGFDGGKAHAPRLRELEKAFGLIF